MGEPVPLPRSSEARPNRDLVSRETLVSYWDARCMASHLGLDDFPDDVAAEFPSDVRQALVARSRAGATLRMYRRRGWNDSAVRFQYDRAAAALAIALDRWEDRETNPRLF